MASKKGFQESIFSESSRGFVKQWIVNSAEPTNSGGATANTCIRTYSTVSLCILFHFETTSRAVVCTGVCAHAGVP